MKAFCFTSTILVCCTLVGCGNTPVEKKDKALTREDKIEAALAKLDPQDRKLAEAQKFCPVQEKQRLGSMGTPVKVMVDGEAVFLCCGHCKDKVDEDKVAVVKKVKELLRRKVIAACGLVAVAANYTGVPWLIRAEDGDHSTGPDCCCGGLGGGFGYPP